MHLVTDFDGVWTDPSRELEAVHHTLVEALALLSGRTRATTADDYADFSATVLGQPHRHGWRIEGRLTSYVDEDSFALPTAIGQYIDAAADRTAGFYRDAILRQWGAVSEFLDHCYHSTCDRFRATHPHDLARGAEKVLAWLVAHGCQVTFVTNAPAAKVIDWFAHQGVAVDDAGDPPAAPGPLKVYGRAGKQRLGCSGASVLCGGREVQIDRPSYRAILSKEKADAVLGDVYSLDLALPLAMRARGEEGAPVWVGLMHLRHTPQWVLQGVPQQQAPDWRLAHVTSLPRLISSCSDLPPRCPNPEAALPSMDSIPAGRGNRA